MLPILDVKPLMDLGHSLGRAGLLFTALERYTHGMAGRTRLSRLLLWGSALCLVTSAVPSRSMAPRRADESPAPRGDHAQLALQGQPEKSAPTEAQAPREVLRRSYAALGTSFEVLVQVPEGLSRPHAVAALGAAHWKLLQGLRPLEREVVEVEQTTQSPREGDVTVGLSPPLLRWLEEAQRVAVLTEGAYTPLQPMQTPQAQVTQPSAGGPPLPGAPRPGVVPLEASSSRGTSWGDRFDIDPLRRRVRLVGPTHVLHLRPLLWAEAMEVMAAELEGQGLVDFLIMADGHILVRGARAQGPWRLGLQDPRAPGAFGVFQPERPGVLATIGDYRVPGSAPQSPTALAASDRLRSATIWSPSARSSVLWARALFALGSKRGAALFARLDGVEAVWVTDENEVGHTAGLGSQWVYRPPTDNR